MKSLKALLNVNIIKTLYFNFHYFPFKTAIRLPVFIYKKTVLYRMGGVIKLKNIRTGMVKLGPHFLGIKDYLYSRTMWDVSGKVIFCGRANIGRGSKVSCGKEGTITFGEDFTSTANMEIVCNKDISFGNDCLLAWDVLIMDSDLHNIKDEKGVVINPSKPVSIGNHVWIGCRNTILKGVSIASNTIISANSTITKSISDSYCIIGGNGKTTEVLKRNVNWEH